MMEWSHLVSYIPHSIKEALRKKFADLANDFYQRLRQLSSQISGIDGPLEVIARSFLL